MVPLGHTPERRLSDAEAIMWALEADPALRSAFMSVTFLEKAPDFGRFRARVAEAVAALPALDHRVVHGPVGAPGPYWERDPRFDLDFHVRRIALPAPGTRRQLLDLAALICRDPLEHARPLWQFTVVEGLEGGQAALLAKMHHVLSDGVGAIRMSSSFLDLTADGRRPEPDTRAPAAEVPEVAATGSVLAGSLGTVRSVAGQAIGVVVRPQDLARRAAGTASGALAAGRSVGRQLAVVGPALSPLWTGRQSLALHFEVLSTELETVKATAVKLGGTVNDVFVTAIAGAVGGYHQARGAEVADLRMSMPVSTRQNRSAGGNFWAPTRVLVPTGPLDPQERFAEVHSRLNRTKSDPTIGLTASLTGLARNLPAPLILRVARQQVATVDFTCSNVRGAPFDLWIGGARVLANHPMGPTAGTAFNATVISYKGNFDVGLNIDAGSVDDPADLRDRVAGGFAELAAAAGA